jgi:hypothetical protein
LTLGSVILFMWRTVILCKLKFFDALGVVTRPSVVLLGSLSGVRASSQYNVDMTRPDSLAGGPQGIHLGSDTLKLGPVDFAMLGAGVPR